VRASMGSIFARPPARGEPAGTRIALERGAQPLAAVEAEPPIVVCLGAEREGLPADFASDLRAGIPLRESGPDSLNVAMAATVALYELGNRMAAHG
jgi:tRNA G18 (ribose-2'-O)-methylase SpoU